MRARCRITRWLPSLMPSSVRDLGAVEAGDVAQRDHRRAAARAASRRPRPRSARAARASSSRVSGSVSKRAGGCVQPPRLRRPRDRRPGRRGRRSEARERDLPRLADRTRPRAVGEDAEDPRLQRRTLLEAVDAADDAEPGLLHDVVGERVGAHERARQAPQLRVVAGHELHEGRLVTRSQPLDELVVVVHAPTLSDPVRVLLFPAAAARARCGWGRTGPRARGAPAVSRRRRRS